MEQKFREWLVQRGNTGAASSYPKAIKLISEHYSKETGNNTNIYSIKDQILISEIAHDYSQTGRFSKFGFEQKGRFRAAIARYSEFFVQHDRTDPLPDPPEEPDPAIRNNFAYERDLQTSLCAQISELFPGYKIFGNEFLGIEYSIGGKRINVLLENEDGELLAVELKSGVADFKVFGQISMYIGLLMDQFPEKKISGVIIAGAIDSSLKQACSITDRITLKIYRMSIELDDA
jgi:hypothetical protein